GRPTGPFPRSVRQVDDRVRLDDGRILAEILPQAARGTLAEAIRYCASGLRAVRGLSILCTVPDDKGEEFRASGEQMAALQTEPYLFCAARRQEDGSVAEQPLLRVERNPDVPLADMADVLGLVTLAPLALAGLLAHVKPWHLSVLGVPGFEDAEPP